MLLKNCQAKNAWNWKQKCNETENWNNTMKNIKNISTVYEHRKKFTLNLKCRSIPQQCPHKSLFTWKIGENERTTNNKL